MKTMLKSMLVCAVAAVEAIAFPWTLFIGMPIANWVADRIGLGDDLCI